jgi:hypothetical protein
MKAKTAYSMGLDVLGNRKSRSNRELVTAALNSWRQKLVYFSMFAALPGILALEQQEARAEEVNSSEPTVPGKNVKIVKASNGRHLSPEFLKRQSRYRLPHQPGSFDMVSTFTGTDDCPGKTIPDGTYTSASPYIDSGDTTGANDTVKRVQFGYYYWYYYSYDSAGPDHIYSFKLSARGPNPQISVETTSGT